jgi:hypothetical protein
MWIPATCLILFYFFLYTPYSKNRAEMQRRIDEDKQYLLTDVCLNSKTRVKVGRHAQCAQAEDNVARGTWDLAIEKTFNDLSICSTGGQCTVGGFNISEALGTIVKCLLFFAMGVAVIIVLKMVNHTASSVVSSGMLPQNSATPQYVAMRAHQD